jgi:uncharacterized membrane protein
MFAPAGGGPGINEGALAAFFGAYCLFLVVVLAVMILFLLMLMRTLQLVRPRNRAMEPGQVWLNFVPCLNIVWQFLTVLWVAKSLDAEYRDRGMHEGGEDYGKKLGLTGLIVNIVGGILANVVSQVGSFTRDMTLVFVALGLSVVVAVIALVIFVMYWIKIAGFRKELQESRGREGDEYEDDRDAPYRGRRDDRDDDDDRDRRDDREDDLDDDRGYRRRFD